MGVKIVAKERGCLSDLNICSVLREQEQFSGTSRSPVSLKGQPSFEDHLSVSGRGGRKKGEEEESWEGRRVSKPATGRLTIALGILEGGMQLPLCDWLTDARKKGKSLTTPPPLPHHHHHPSAPQPRRAGRD